MKQRLPRTWAVPLVALAVAGCSGLGRESPTRLPSDTETAEPETLVRHCFRNEYPFADEPDRRDVEILTVEIDGARAVGEYAWLPAFKDQRLGRFEGAFDGRSVAALYRFSQEGRSVKARLRIVLDTDRAIVEGEDPQYGLDAIVSRIDCERVYG